MDPISSAVLVLLFVVVTAGVLMARRLRYARAEKWMTAASEHPELADEVSHVAAATEVKDSPDSKLWEATMEPGTRKIW